MAASWRKYRGVISSHNNQASRGTSVPTWEKRFCYEVGSMPWKRFLEAKKFVSESDKVVQWNDSACKRAFDSAKCRFWAKINGLPCRIPLPNPDIYIDEVDWNSKIDPELFSGMEMAVGDEDDEEESVSVNSWLLLDQQWQHIKPTGWDVVDGDEVEKRTLLTGMVVGDC